MSKKKHLQVFVRVLQNGHPICEAHRPLSKADTLCLSAATSGALAMPLYPLADEVPLVQIRRRRASLILNQAWSGVVVSRGQPIPLNRHQSRSQTYPLVQGDYASLVLGDLRVLVKLINPPPPARTGGPASGYRGAFTSLLFHDRAEKIAMAVALFMATAITACICVGLNFYQKKPPRHFEELADSYTLPFINDVNLTSSPEALQKRLNRSDYIGSVVNYYRNVTELIMGWPLADDGYLFESSRSLYADYYARYHTTIDEFIAAQTAADRQLLAQPGASLVAIPSVYGESFQERLLRMIAKIDSLHESFRLALDYRRKVSKDFRSDPAYDWNAYLNKQDAHKAPAAVNPEMAKIDVFHQLTNEEAMYSEAEAFGRRARLLQRRQESRQEAQTWLAAANVRPIYIPAGVNFASFLHQGYDQWSDDALGQLQASEFGTKKADKPLKEPLIGQVDPRALTRAVHAHRYELNLCYEFALRRNQSLMGRMDWAWRIDSLGKISDISLVTTTLRDRQMIDCVRRKLASWTFPRPRRGSVKVFHTFEFKPQSG